MKGSGVLHETILGADTQSVIVALDVSSSKTDHHVFVQMSLGAEITTEEVKGQREEVLSFLTGAACVRAAGTAAETMGVAGKKEDHLVCRLLLRAEPLHWAHLSYSLPLPLFKDDLASAVVLKKVGEAADRVKETHLRWVNHQDLNEGQEHAGGREGSPRAPACGGGELC